MTNDVCQLYFPDYRAVDIGKDWRWKNFTPREMACKQLHKKPNGAIVDCGCGGSLLIDFRFMDMQQEFRDVLGIPYSPNSAYRCPAHNRNVGGAKNSYHARAQAVDVPISKERTREKIHAAARAVGFNGIADYKTFVHVDCRATKWYADFR